MVDSAHQSVTALKAELQELAAEADDARAAADQAERRLHKVGLVWRNVGFVAPPQGGGPRDSAGAQSALGGALRSFRGAATLAHHTYRRSIHATTWTAIAYT
jgi:hypothetical protein